MTMTSKNIQAVIVGDVTARLHKELRMEDKSKRNIIKFIQEVRGKISDTKYKFIKQLSHQAYEDTKTHFRDTNRNLQMSVGVTIEALFFRFEDACKEFYGDCIIDMMVKATEKMTDTYVGEYVNVPKDSFDVADRLAEDIRRVVFNYNKG